MLTYADVCLRMLTYADVCLRMLAYACVCLRMLAYACVCSKGQRHRAATELQQRGLVGAPRAATELQQSCIRAATELQQSCNVCACACSEGQRHFHRHRSAFPGSHVPAWAEGERGATELQQRGRVCNRGGSLSESEVSEWSTCLN